MYHSGMRLILASASPRRAALLREAGYEFDVDPAHVDESELAGEAARSYVVRVAALKARTVAARHPDDVVLAADTTVVVDGVMLAKPLDDADAARMLRLLSGRAHEVLTGVVVIRAGCERSESVSTRVRFKPLGAAEIALVRLERRASRQGGRLRRSGAGLPIRRIGRGFLQQRRGPAGCQRAGAARRRWARADDPGRAKGWTEPGCLTPPAPEGIL